MELQEVTKTLKELEIYSHRNVNEIFAGNYKSAFKGAGLEVKNLRQYAEGDDAKHIDWITSARQGKLYVKEFQETRELTTFLLVDISASMDFGSKPLFKKEVVLRTAAILLYSALKNNDAFGAVLFSDKVEVYIPAKKGQAHLLRILREIIEQLDTNAYKTADAEKAMHFFNNVVKKQAITFFISDELSERVGKAMQIANSKHDFCFVNVFDPFERNPKHHGLVRVEDPETGEQMVVDFSNKKMKKRYVEQHKERKNKFEQILKRNRIDVVSVGTDANIYKELMLFFKRRQLRN